MSAGASRLRSATVRREESAGVDGQCAGGDGTVRRQLGRQPERAEQAPDSLGLGHRAHDPARAGTAGTDEDLDREHAAAEAGPRPLSWSARAGVRARVTVGAAAASTDILDAVV